MKKCILALLCSLVLTSCSSEISIGKYINGYREYDGFIYKIVPSGTLISDFTTELQDDQIIYIPSSIKNYSNGEPMPVLIGDLNFGVLSSDALKVLYVTGGQTTFGVSFKTNLDNLEFVVINSISPSLKQIESLRLSWLPPESVDTLAEHPIRPYVLAHEVYDEFIRLAHDNFSSNAPENYIAFALVSSRASYYYNYEDSPNDGLYRIGMEYEIGTDLTPPDDPTRIKNQNLFGTEYYTFKGWSSDKTTFIPYDFSTSEDEVDVQLYAYWE